MTMPSLDTHAAQEGKMSDVKRFYMLIRSGVAEMVPTKDADWVRSSDYDALAARHRAAIDALLGFKWRDTPEGPCFCVLFKEQGAKHTSGCRKASAVLKEKP